MRGVNAALLGISAGALAGLSPGFANLGLGRWCQARRSAARAIPARLADGYERLQDPSIIFQQVETGTSSPSSVKLEVMLPDTRDVEVLSDLLLESFAEVLEPWMLPDSLGPVSSAWNWLVKAWEKEVIKSTLDMNHKKTMMQPSLRKPRGWQFEGESVGILLVAEGEIVSFLELCSLPADGRTSDDALATLLMVFGGEKSARPYLQNFCVSPRWRRRGLGRTMLRLAETVVRDVWREDRLYLHAGNTEASRELYRSSGYQMTGLFQNAESLHMSKTLEPETEKEKEFAMSN